MKDLLARTHELIGRYDRELAELVPAGSEIFDAHVHIGRDIDGYAAPLEDLREVMGRYGVSRAFAFCLDEPDRHPAFSAANDRTLDAAGRAEGAIVPFVRLDLAESPVQEAVRCLDRGAKGIKLHPRAQGFLLDDERLEPIFALAAERGVPILIHGGRGLPPIAAHLHRLVERNPGAPLIVAHGGIADLAALSEAFAGHPGVFFDTSLWSGVDLLDLFSRVSPGQVLYASDYPYGMQPSSLTLALRTARAAGSSEEQVRDLLGRSAARIADGVEAPGLSPALGPRVLRQPITLARIHGYITMATPLLWTRQPDTIGILGLAINACDERDGHVDERERIAELLSCARDLWQTFPGMEDERDRLSLGRATFRLIHLADIVAVTTLD